MRFLHKNIWLSYSRRRLSGQSGEEGLRGKHVTHSGVRIIRYVSFNLVLKYNIHAVEILVGNIDDVNWSKSWFPLTTKSDGLVCCRSNGG